MTCLPKGPYRGDYSKANKKPSEQDLLISRLLKMASTKFSNHGCNDLPNGFWDGISDDYKRRLFVELEDGEFTKEEVEEDLKKFERQADWVLMSYFKRKLANG